MNILMLTNRLKAEGDKFIRLEQGNTYTAGKDIGHTLACELINEGTAIKTIIQENVYA